MFFLKKFVKFSENMYAGVPFSIKLQVAGGKKDSDAGMLLWIFRNFQDQLFSGTCTNCCFWYLWISLPPASSTLRKCTVFSTILGLIYFKLIFQSCTTLGVYLEPYEALWQKYLSAFSRCFRRNAPS